MTKPVQLICKTCHAITYRRKRIETICSACGSNDFDEVQKDKYQCGQCGEWHKYGISCDCCD